MSSFMSCLRTILAILVLLSFAPFTALCIFVVSIFQLVCKQTSKVSQKMEPPKRVLVTGAKMSKTSWVVRMLGKAGHQVWAAEVATYTYNHTRLSKYCKGFKVLPRPEKDFKLWRSELEKMVAELQIDLLIPCTSPIESKYYAQLEALGFPCKIFFIQGETCDILDDKFKFAEFCRSKNLAVPETHLITDVNQVSKIVQSHPESEYIIKPIEYDPVLRLDLKPINIKTIGNLSAYLESRNVTKERRFVLQERLETIEYGCFALAWEGKLLGFSIFPSDPSCLIYESSDYGYAETMEFCSKLCTDLNITGMFTVDFLKNKAGKLLAIECNPRIHSGCVLLSRSAPRVGSALAGTITDDVIVCRDCVGKGEKYYWFFDQLLKCLGFWKSGKALSPVQWIFSRWALWDYDDPWPFFGMYHVQIPSLLLQDLFAGQWEWTKIDFCIGKIVKKGGD